MISGNSTSIFRFFLIFSMNFAWIGNVFGFVSAKRDAFTAKRFTKSIKMADAVKNEQVTQVFQFNRSEMGNVQTTVSPVYKKLVLVRLISNEFRPANKALSEVEKQMLFPHHGFW